MNRQERLRAIAELLESQATASQREIVEMLLEQGVSVTQPTIGRDLKEIGAFKVRSGDGSIVYTLDEQAQTSPKGVEVHLRKVFGEWVRDMNKSGNLLVLSTAPGAAHVVAAALDRSKYPGVLATLGGDDTVLVIAKEESDPARLLAGLRKLAGLSGDSSPFGKHNEQPLEV